MKSAHTPRQRLHLALLCLLAVCLFGLVLVHLSGWQDVRRQQQLAEAVAPSPAATTEPSAAPSASPQPYVSPVDFARLQTENPDAYAWLRIEGAEVDTPVLQNALETDYYLDHTFEKKKGLPGAVYSRNDTPQDFEAPCTVLYGHNMKSGSMFGNLRHYRSADFFNDPANRTIQIFTPEKELTYKIFAAVEYGNLLLTHLYDFTDPKEKADFIASLQDGLVDSTVPLDENSQLLVLSTCAPPSHGDRRYLVVGVLAHEKA